MSLEAIQNGEQDYLTQLRNLCLEGPKRLEILKIVVPEMLEKVFGFLKGYRREMVQVFEKNKLLIVDPSGGVPVSNLSEKIEALDTDLAEVLKSYFPGVTENMSKFIAGMFGLSDEQVQTFKVGVDEPVSFEISEKVAAVMALGSPANIDQAEVCDGSTSVHKLLVAPHGAVCADTVNILKTNLGKPTVGVCYGHQLLHAMAADDSERGVVSPRVEKRVGLRNLEFGGEVINDLGQRLSLKDDVKDLLSKVVTYFHHSREVKSDLIEGIDAVRSLNSSELHDVAWIGDNVLTLQSHPELAIIYYFIMMIRNEGDWWKYDVMSAAAMLVVMMKTLSLRGEISKIVNL